MNPEHPNPEDTIEMCIARCDVPVDLSTPESSATIDHIVFDLDDPRLDE